MHISDFKGTLDCVFSFLDSYWVIICFIIKNVHWFILHFFVTYSHNATWSTSLLSASLDIQWQKIIIITFYIFLLWRDRLYNISRSLERLYCMCGIGGQLSPDVEAILENNRGKLSKNEFALTNCCHFPLYVERLPPILGAFGIANVRLWTNKPGYSYSWITSPQLLIFNSCYSSKTLKTLNPNLTMKP